MERIVIVDEFDNAVGEREKTECHLGEGILHRAFLAMVLDGEGRLLLTRRSPVKMLWPGYWDGTVASHLFRGEGYEDASKRRLEEEIGLEADPRYLFKFRYKARYRDVGVEHEICAVTMARGVDAGRLRPDPGEVSETRLVELGALFDEIRRGPGEYTPWLVRALEQLEGRHWAAPRSAF